MNGNIKKQTKSQDDLNDEAIDLLSSDAADDFARALDRCGWMIVPRPDLVADMAEAQLALGVWQMNAPGETPDWANPWDGLDNNGVDDD